ncbi:MAG TPA: 4-hydroxy-tetrahydrodipicolinate reductase [Candidatus Atribacteria bacterium]|nr:4-hydroxy-tetrahydrodipicolinate reductase [Candidatus Atribacteria bacterium]
MMKEIGVFLVGAAGKMGREIVRAIQKEEGIVLRGAADKQEVGKDAGELSGVGPLGITIEENLAEAINKVKPDVICDFTQAAALRENLPLFLDGKIPLVIGTTGLSSEEIETLRRTCNDRGIGCVIAPNFALGAVLMMYFSRIAARYLERAEIIEYHHSQKKDAPSGTAIKTAQGIGEIKSTSFSDKSEEILSGARGALLGSVNIHSVRLPGFIAHQEVIWGGEGEILTIRHDSLSRSSFMPGVMRSIKKVYEEPRFYYGLEEVIGLTY